jgi:hypothetical protein
VLEISYRIEAPGFGPRAIDLNGRSIPFARGANPYRTGAAEIEMGAFREALRSGRNSMTIFL